MKSMAEIKDLLTDHKEEVSKRYKVREIGIFGSFARGEQKNNSDIDILVEFNAKYTPGLLKLSEMERYLQKVLKQRVDLVIKSGLRPELKKGILKEVIYI